MCRYVPQPVNWPKPNHGYALTFFHAWLIYSFYARLTFFHACLKSVFPTLLKGTWILKAVILIIRTGVLNTKSINDTSEWFTLNIQPIHRTTPTTPHTHTHTHKSNKNRSWLSRFGIRIKQINCRECGSVQLGVAQCGWARLKKPHTALLS